jgi:hypothetical protein
MSLAREYTVCSECGLLIANEEMHDAYHLWVNATIFRMNQMLQIIWDDAKLDKDKKLDPLPPPPEIDY